jgi:hypothetical protein
VKGNDPAHCRAVCVEHLDRQQHLICRGFSKTSGNRYASKDNQGNTGKQLKALYR